MKELWSNIRNRKNRTIEELRQEWSKLIQICSKIMKTALYKRDQKGL